jgi:hypothetical protein
MLEMMHLYQRILSRYKSPVALEHSASAVKA